MIVGGSFTKYWVRLFVQSVLFISKSFLNRKKIQSYEKKSHATRGKGRLTNNQQAPSLYKPRVENPRKGKFPLLKMCQHVIPDGRPDTLLN